MADEEVIEEAFRTAVGMTSAVLRQDMDGVLALWEGSAEPDRVAHWLSAVAATAVIQAAHARGVTPQTWLDGQLELFRGSGG